MHCRHGGKGDDEEAGEGLRGARSAGRVSQGRDVHDAAQKKVKQREERIRIWCQGEGKEQSKKGEGPDAPEGKGYGTSSVKRFSCQDFGKKKPQCIGTSLWKVTISPLGTRVVKRHPARGAKYSRK